VNNTFLSLGIELAVVHVGLCYVIPLVGSVGMVKERCAYHIWDYIKVIFTLKHIYG